jgi:hypothetical protein
MLTGERAGRAVLPQCAIWMPGLEHRGELGPLAAGCEHEHVQNLFGCADHIGMLSWAEREKIAFLCSDCGHACRLMVTAGGRVYRFNLEKA